MAAYQKSAYGDDSVSDLVRDFTMHQVRERREQEAEERAHSERGEYVRQKQNSTRRAYQYYYAQEMKDRAEFMFEKMKKEQPKFSAFQTLRRHNDAAIKFKFPTSVYQDPSEALNEGAIGAVVKPHPHFPPSGEYMTMDERLAERRRRGRL